MNMLADWFQKCFPPKEEAPDPVADFDVMYIAIPGFYYGRIEEAEVRAYTIDPLRAYVALRIRLNPDDDKDVSQSWIRISPYRYAKLLNSLGLARTNDVTVLQGQHVGIHVVEERTPFGNSLVPVASLLDPLVEDKLAPKPKTKRRSMRARTPSRKKSA